MVMGTEEGKTKLEKDKGNASACFMWELTACQDSFYLCCHGGRTQCLALPETLTEVHKNTCSAIKELQLNYCDASRGFTLTS